MIALSNFSGEGGTGRIERRQLYGGRAGPAAELAMHRVVMLQEATISFPFTVGHIVAMGRSPWCGTDRADDDDRAAREALATADVEQFKDRTAELLSEVYRHPVQVWPHPETTFPVILPARH